MSRTMSLEEGDRYLSAYQDHEALKHFLKSPDQTNVAVIIRIAEAYFNLLMLSKSIQYSDLCIKLDNSIVKAYVLKANAQRHLSRFRESYETLRNALSVCGTPADGEVLKSLSLLVAKINTEKADKVEQEEIKTLLKKLRSGRLQIIDIIGNSEFMDLLCSLFDDADSTVFTDESFDKRIDELKNADEAKALGNEFYKSKRFSEAVQCYDRAICLKPSIMAFYSNKSAVYYEISEFDKCRQLCTKAVEVGRLQKEDFKSIARVLARVARSYVKENEYQEALRYFDRSLAEHRNQDVLKERSQATKKLEEMAKLKMYDPELAEKEKIKGNELFQKGDYPSALKHYSEAIKRNPDDARYYSNRAACYAKLMEFEMSLKDCDKCIELDPKFIKAYLRKGSALIALRQYARAQSAYEGALELDPSCQEARDGVWQSTMKSRSDGGDVRGNEEDIAKRVMEDPEVAQIVSDPAMQLILSQMQDDPTALREHLKNPEIRKKIQKLIQAGVIRVQPK
ncbi:hypothetical protein ACOME3_002630 [Neoechinorhynchus agilis]